MTDPTNPPTTPKGIYLTRVLSNTPLCREHFRLVLEVNDFPEARAGQFLQILCADPAEEGWTGGAFIRRPISIGGLDRAGKVCRLELVHRAIGRGTRWLSRVEPGDAVSIIGPLGRPFDIRADRKVACLVGGGVGLPPMIWLARSLAKAGKQVVAFAGARTADILPLTRIEDVQIVPGQPSLAMAEFARARVPVVLSTDDGSLGATGQIPDFLAAWLDEHADQAGQTAVYTCGPEPMMRAAARLCEARNLPCQVSLERMMACGMGTCQSCVVPVQSPADPEGWQYQLCCQDGPVFDSRLVIWNQQGPKPA